MMLCAAAIVMKWTHQLLFSLGEHSFLQSINMNAVADTAVFFGKFLYYFLESVIFKIIPKRKKDVTGEIVLITGAGSGLGRLLAMHFASHGAILVLWDINQEGNMETCRLAKEKGGVKVFAYKCDCSNRKEVYRVADQVSLALLFALTLRKLLLSCTFPNPKGVMGSPKGYCVLPAKFSCLKYDFTASKKQAQPKTVGVGLGPASGPSAAQLICLATLSLQGPNLSGGSAQ